MRKWIGVGIVVASMLIGGGIWVHAQNPRVPFPPLPFPPVEPGTPLLPGLQGLPGFANVISGSDIGFRVDYWEGDTPVGRWVVRSPQTGNQWVEPKGAASTRRITSH